MVLGAAFTIGAVVGASMVVPMLVVIAGLVSPLPEIVRFVALGLLGCYATILGLAALPHHLPQNRQQIALGVISAASPRGAARFGLLMGTGLFTFLPSASVHLLAAGVVLTLAGWVAALAAAIGFGLGRGGGLVARALSVDRIEFEDRFQQVVFALRRVAAPAVLALVLTAAVG